MKFLVILSLCALVAVQGHRTEQLNTIISKSSNTIASEAAPWVLHLRVAVTTSDLLTSGVGALVSNKWALTSADTVKDARLIMVRYGAMDVLVTDTSLVNFSPDNKVALINLDTYVESTDVIAPIALAVGSVPSTASLYGYGDNGGAPRGLLKYFNVALKEQDDGSIIATSDEGTASKFDVGAPLVSNGVLVALLVKEGNEENAGVFVPTAAYSDWIIEKTDLRFNWRDCVGTLTVVNSVITTVVENHC